MDKPIEITQGSTYIFKGKKASNNTTYRKYKILEVTGVSYLIKNIDADVEFRVGIMDFNYDYKPVEIIETNEERINKLVQRLAN